VTRAHRILLLLAGVFTLTPWASPALALALGGAIALSLGNPEPELTRRLGRRLLQVSVVGLGFGMPVGAVLTAGAAGIGYTTAGIVVAIIVGLLLGRWLRIERHASVLITAGTSICGGSAIAAIGPAIGAGHEAMSVALATVFVLNAVALYLFPIIGHALHLSQHQFAVWAALGIHDTSSVVGAAASYGAAALQEATVLKLVRALWIIPLTLAAAVLAPRWGTRTDASRRPRLPWFIGLFVIAALLRSALPVHLTPLLDGLARAARVALVLTLYLIGLGLTRDTLRQVGHRPLLQGLLLWALLGGGTLLAVREWVTG
jgi:uncharacterized integral membrane protein (TIGR00698 family)